MTSKRSKEGTAAHPLTFLLTHPADQTRWATLQPPPGASLGASCRQAFAEIERTWTLDSAALQRFREGLERALAELDERTAAVGGAHEAIHDAAAMAALAEAERIVANAARAYLIEQGAKTVRGRSTGGKNKAAPEWHAKAIKHGRYLLDNGKAAHEITSLCAQKVERTADVVRPILQAAGLIDSRKKAASSK